MSSKGTAPSSSTGRQPLFLIFPFLRTLRIRRPRARAGPAPRSPRAPPTPTRSTRTHPRTYQRAPGTLASPHPQTTAPRPTRGPPHQPHAQGHPPTTLLWSELEPWMDAEYARQVCMLMCWEARVCVPLPGFSDDNPNNFPFTYSNGGHHNGWHGRAANNGGCCVLTFESAAAAAAALTQVNITSTPGSAPMTMPNSARAFMLKWASPDLAAAAAVLTPSSAVPSTSSPPTLSDNLRNVPLVNVNSSVNGYGHRTTGSVGGGSVGSVSRDHGGAGVASPTSPLSPAYPLEYSIFVADFMATGTGQLQIWTFECRKMIREGDVAHLGVRTPEMHSLLPCTTTNFNVQFVKDTFFQLNLACFLACAGSKKFQLHTSTVYIAAFKNYPGVR
ncbi:hypothetical protein B0H11DRAFT_2098644, partial [Mycena galericulata]